MRKKTYLKLVEYQTEQSEKHLNEVRSIHKEMRGYKHDFHHHLQTLKGQFEAGEYFHIVKNLNEKVIGEIRKGEQRRLEAAGDKDGAKLLKHSKYILTSSRKTLEEKDSKSSASLPVPSKTDSIFKRRAFNQPKCSLVAKYDELIASNSLLFTCDLLKEKLRIAYTQNNVLDMSLDVLDMIDLCEGSENKHLKWFGRMLENHFDGIIAHARFRISAGKIEGINNRIKTIRRMGYGYPDDEYFFLKLIDMSRSKDT